MTLQILDKKQSGSRALKLQKFDNSSLYTTKLDPKALSQTNQLTLTIELNTGEKFDANWYVGLQNQ